MSETSRRKFLAAAGVGATAGTIALATGAASAAEARRTSESANEPVLAIVDHTSSELRLLVGEREVVVHDRDLVDPHPERGGRSQLMSSHREAPEISKDPVADSTDVYAFVSPDRPDTVTLIANFIPLQKPDGGPNFYEFGDDVLLRDPRLQQGQGHARRDLPVPLRHRDPQPEDVPLQHRPDRRHRRHRPGTGRSTTRSPGSRGASTRRSSASSLTCPPVNVGPRSTPDYAKLAGQAVHTAGRRSSGLRRPACRRVPRRPGQHLRPRCAASVQRGAPDLDAEHERPQRRAVLQRAHDRDPGPDRGGHPRRERADRPDGRRRSVIGVWATASRRKGRGLQHGEGQVHRQRSVGAGLPAREPAVQRGHRADGREGRLELRRARRRRAAT